VALAALRLLSPLCQKTLCLRSENRARVRRKQPRAPAFVCAN
jgi:hypothetical protein